MICQLITRARDLLAATLGGGVHVAAGPVAPPTNADLPLLALGLGPLTLSRKASDSGSGQPRPQTYRQQITVAAGTPQGPYALDHQPLAGTAQGLAIFSPDVPAERRVPLRDRTDFTIDPTGATVTFIADVAAAGIVVLTYSFVGIYTVQDFEQALLVDVYAADTTTMERLASLASGTLLTAHDDLVGACNSTPSVYTAGAITTTHHLSRFQLLGAEITSDPALRMSLSLAVQGQILAARAAVGGFGLITTINSRPGAPANGPVDVDIGLD